MDAILAGKESVPLQGAASTSRLKGRGKGRLSGRARGVDYLRMRADGRIDLDLDLTIETDDGHRIALSGDGQAAPRNGEPILDILRTSVSPPPPRSMHGLMRGRSEA